MKKILIVPAFIAAFAAPCAAEFKDPGAAKAALSSASEDERLAAITYLGSLRTSDAYETMARHFGEEPAAYLRSQTVERMDVNVSSWAFKCVLDAAGDENKVVRQVAASRIARKAGDPRADQRIAALSADSSESVRIAIVRALSLNVSTSAVTAMGRVLADRKGSLTSRRMAADMLSKMNRPDADAELMKHLSDADPKIKATAQSRRPSKAKPVVKKK